MYLSDTFWALRDAHLNVARGLHRAGTVFAAQFLQCLLGNLGTLLRLTQLLLQFSVLAQVQTGQFFRLFDLAFVGLDLLLQFVHQVLHALVVLLPLIRLELQLFWTTYRNITDTQECRVTVKCCFNAALTYWDVPLKITKLTLDK